MPSKFNTISFQGQTIYIGIDDIPTTDKDRKQKEDKRDSRKIAKSLRNGELEGIYVPSYEMEELRSLVRYRKILIIYRFDVILKNTQNSVIRIPAMLVKYLPGNTLRNPEII